MPDTRWSLVRRSQFLTDPAAVAALGELMKLYWEPLYAYARRRGESPADAEDAVQGYYEMFITRGSISSVDQERGKLRSFLLTSFERYLIDQWEKRTATKRGGRQPILSLDQQLAEQRYSAEPAHHLTPEHLYERRWAMTLLQRAMEALEADYKRRGKVDTFLSLRSALEWNSADFAYAQVGLQLGMNENAVKQAVFRMRKKFRELLRWVVAETVADPVEIDKELAHLVAALSQ
jgi:RNA polymerase sigma factor (sigma-70 family)